MCVGGGLCQLGGGCECSMRCCCMHVRIGGGVVCMCGCQGWSAVRRRLHTPAQQLVSMCFSEAPQCSVVLACWAILQAMRHAAARLLLRRISPGQSLERQALLVVSAVQGVNWGVGEATVPPGENVPRAQGLH